MFNTSEPSGRVSVDSLNLQIIQIKPSDIDKLDEQWAKIAQNEGNKDHLFHLLVSFW